MRIIPPRCLFALCTGSVAVLACAPAANRPRIPPAPIVFHWPDPAFLPQRQCHGTISTDDVQYYLPRARLALDLPSTVTVMPDPGGHCIDVVVESVGAGRLAELALRGAGVPRRAVLLTLESARLSRQHGKRT